MAEGVKLSRGRSRGRSVVDGLRNRFKNGIESGLKGNGQSGQNSNHDGQGVVDVVHDSDDEKADEQKDAVSYVPLADAKHLEDTKRKMKEVRASLNTMCKVILQLQVPLLWEERAHSFNERVA